VVKELLDLLLIGDAVLEQCNLSFSSIVLAFFEKMFLSRSKTVGSFIFDGADKGNVTQDKSDLLRGDLFISVSIVDLEGESEFGVQIAHVDLCDVIDELLSVDDAVPILVDYRKEPIAQHLWQAAVVLECDPVDPRAVPLILIINLLALVQVRKYFIEVGKQ